MLVENDERPIGRQKDMVQDDINGNCESVPALDLGAMQNRLTRNLSIEWLGQTAASTCWIVSVFVYGIESMGDWLQLFAATFWLAAHVSAAFKIESAPARERDASE